MINRDLIKDDLYEAVNAEYLSKLEIPGDRKSIGAFALIDMNIEKQLLEDFKSIPLDDPSVSVYMAEYLKFYRSIVNNKNRELTKDSAVYDVVKAIQGIKNKKDLNDVLITLREYDMKTLFYVGVYNSFENSDLNIMWVDVAPTILPSKEYYADTDNKDKLLDVFRNASIKILNKFDIENAEKLIDDAFALDEKIVEYVKSSEELADYTKMYNPIDYSDLLKFSDFIDFDAHVKHFIKKDIEYMSITQPRFFENFSKLFNEDNLEEIKSYLLVKFLFKVSDLFDEELRHIQASYANAVLGIKEVKNVEKFAYSKGMEIFQQTVGIYYGKKYFGEDAKKDIYEIVNNIIDMYKERLDSNPWLQRATKDKALLKLSTINVMLGYPDKLPEVYKKMKYDENKDLFENYMVNLKEHIYDNFGKYGEPVDHTLWGMPACMVNAYYNPSSNLICFPAAILNDPFYSYENSRSKNYGGIGAVVGHEISHAFDNNGAQFDEKGNMKNWWLESDYEQFKTYQKQMIEQFDGREIYGGKVNGTLVVSENLADVGGLACAIACAKKEKACNLEELFLNFARVWANKANQEYLEYLLKVDVHAPGKLRANVQVANMDEFYEVFDVKEGDKMFIPKDKRIVVW